MRMPLVSFAAALAGAFVSAAAQAGVYLESVDKDVDDKQAGGAVSKMWFDGGRMRTERKSSDGDSQIVLFKDQALYMLDPSTKSYRVMDKATAENMGDQMSAARKQMEERMANMPPAQRAQIEAMMSKMGKGAAMAGMPGAKMPERTLKNTGRTETVAGIKCTVWEAFEDGKKDQEMCAAAPGSIPGGDEIMKTFREVGAMMKGLTDSLGGGKENAPWNDMEKLNGVPILTREFEDGKASSEMRLTVVRKESVPGGTFDVPAGFAQKKMGFGPGG